MKGHPRPADTRGNVHSLPWGHCAHEAHFGEASLGRHSCVLGKAQPRAPSSRGQADSQPHSRQGPQRVGYLLLKLAQRHRGNCTNISNLGVTCRHQGRCSVPLVGPPLPRGLPHTQLCRCLCPVPQGGLPGSCSTPGEQHTWALEGSQPGLGSPATMQALSRCELTRSS